MGTPQEIYEYLINYGQSDRKFHLGEEIKYNPLEIKEILEKATFKPPRGCTPYWYAAENRIHNLAEAITRCSTNSREHLQSIKKWAEEISEQCDMVDYLRGFEE